MEYFLFPAYLVLFSWLVTKIRFFKNSGLTNAQLVILLLLKIMAGIFYGWIGIYYGQYAYMFDTWGYHHTAVEEYKLLFNNPAEYFTNLFQNYYPEGRGGLFDSYNSYWNDLKSNVFIKLLSVFNVLSFGNYYINVIFYSFITLTGPVAFYRVLNDVLPGKKIQLLLATFLIPSFLYWTSGIHKDGLVFTALALISYQFYFGLKERRFTLKSWLIIFISFIILFSFRNFIIIILLPALTAWYLSSRNPKRTAVIFITTYLISGILFFTLRYISPALDFPAAVVSKQQAFMNLQGNSGIETRPLEPNVISFIKNAPQAIRSTTLRPHPGDVKHILSLAAASETNLILLLFLCFLIWRTTGMKSPQFIWFSLFFSFSFLLTIGYTVNFLGAIVRYRSIVIPFLLVPMVCLIDWKRIYELLFNNIKVKNNI